VFTRSILRGGPIRVGHHELYLSPFDTVSLLPYLLGIYEREELAIAGRLVNPGDFVLDIGANIGYWSLSLSEMVGSEGRVLAFEPDPDNFALLERNLATNAIRNVQTQNFALSNRDGRVSLYRSETNAGDYSLASRPGASRPAITVLARRLDSLSSAIPTTPAFVKVDVQGLELNVMQGGRRLLGEWSHKTVLLSEFEPPSLFRAGVQPAQFLEFMSDIGYATVLLRKSGWGRVNRCRVIERAEFGQYQAWAGKGANIVFLPFERLSLIERLRY